MLESVMSSGSNNSVPEQTPHMQTRLETVATMLAEARQKLERAQVPVELASAVSRDVQRIVKDVGPGYERQAIHNLLLMWHDGQAPPLTSAAVVVYMTPDMLSWIILHAGLRCLLVLVELFPMSAGHCSCKQTELTPCSALAAWHWL